MSMYKEFATDAKREREGIILDYGEFRVTVARAGGANKDYTKTLERKARPHRRAIQTESFDNERANSLLQEVYAEAVVRNWEVKGESETGETVWLQGIEGKDGAKLPFTKENVLATFVALPDLFRDIMEQSQTVALFKESLLEAAAGN